MPKPIYTGNNRIQKSLYTTPKTEVMSKRVSDAPATGLGKAGGEYMEKMRGALSAPPGPLLNPPKSLKRRK
jgi:hypothetical protein